MVNPATHPTLDLALRSLIIHGLRQSLGCKIDSIAVLEAYQAESQGTERAAGGRSAISWPQTLHLNVSDSIAQRYVNFDIPINRINTKTQIEYVSALAMKLAQRTNLGAAELAEQCVQAWLYTVQHMPADNLGNAIWPHIILTAQASGWLHLHLTDLGLATWLQQLASSPLSPMQLTQISPCDYKHPCDFQSPQIFTVMHSHARCYTLCRIAAANRLIPLTSDPFILQEQLPWLSQQTLRCRQPSTWSLILHLSDTLDHLAQVSRSPLTQASSVMSLKMGNRLSQAFDAFEADCRLWGDRCHDLPLTQVRYGLVLITQHLLQLLLEQLGFSAPQAL